MIEVDDMNSDYEFDLECDEMLHMGKSVEESLKNINHEKSMRQKIRNFIFKQIEQRNARHNR